MKYLSLFSGIGGFEKAIQDVLPNAECVGFSEIDKYAQQIYLKHFPNHKPYGDITKLTTDSIPDFDLLVGGFPCQSFSIAGKRRGFEDTRGTLFFEIARILRDKRPTNFILENVKGLLSSKTFLTFDYICDILFLELVTANKWNQLKNQNALENLGIYLNTIGGEGGLIGRLKFLQTQILQTIKKQKNLNTELMQAFASKGKEWDLFLSQSFSIENLKVMDIQWLDEMVDILGDVELLQKKCSEENLLMMTLSTTSTETNLTTDRQIYLCVQEVFIILYILKQWKLSNTIWKKIQSLSTEKLINTKYYVKTFNIIIRRLTELGYFVEWQVLNSKNFGVPQNRERVFIVGRIGGESRRKVFPIREDSKADYVIPTLTTRYYSGQANGAYLRQISPSGGSQGERVYDSNGISTTIASQAGGLGAKTGLYAIPVLTPDRAKKRQNGRRFKEDGDPSFTLTAQDKHGIFNGSRIRRLTPLECERLQGFPDSWTAYGSHGQTISDAQRYKTLGNAVSVPVVKAIVERLEFNI